LTVLRHPQKNPKFFEKTGCVSTDPARYGALLMRKTGRRTPHFTLIAGSLLFAATAAHGQMVASSKGRFIFKDANGKSDSAEIVTSYAPRKIVQPVVKANSSINPKLLRAATIAEERANAHSRERCWRYVKEALLSSGAVSSYPQSVNAKDAAKELVNNYGFKKLSVRDPYKAPVGSVLVYNAKNGAGHVEIRTKHGFASDFRSRIPSPRPLIGVYSKL
jgi:hypothetical protein